VSPQTPPKSINAFLAKLPKGDTPPPPDERTAIEELVYSFLLWESSVQRADNAFKRCQSSFVDLNDLRVSRSNEVQAVLGKTYPLLEERVERLQASLHEIYIREYEVSLAQLDELSKRDARRYLESLEGMVPFVAARVMLFKLGAHAVPIERRLLEKLIEEGVLEADTDIAKAQGALERHIKADDATAAALKLQSFSEGATAPPARSNSGSKKRTASKKRTTKKTSTKKTTRKKRSSK
jgi:hypothetical protein